MELMCYSSSFAEKTHMVLTVVAEEDESYYIQIDVVGAEESGAARAVLSLGFVDFAD